MMMTTNRLSARTRRQGARPRTTCRLPAPVEGTSVESDRSPRHRYANTVLIGDPAHTTHDPHPDNLDDSGREGVGTDQQRVVRDPRPGCVRAARVARLAYWLAAGWAIHPLWDVVLHYLGAGHAFAPEAWAISCVSFDLLVAAYIALAHRMVASTGAYGTTMLNFGSPGWSTPNSEASWLSSPSAVSPSARAASMSPPARAIRAAAGTVSVRLTGLSLSLT